MVLIFSAVALPLPVQGYNTEYPAEKLYRFVLFLPAFLVLSGTNSGGIGICALTDRLPCRSRLQRQPYLHHLRGCVQSAQSEPVLGAADTRTA